MSSKRPSTNIYRVFCLTGDCKPARWCKYVEKTSGPRTKWLLRHVDHVTAINSSNNKALSEINIMKDYIYEGGGLEAEYRLSLLLSTKKSRARWSCCLPFQRAAEQFEVEPKELESQFPDCTWEQKEILWDLSTIFPLQEILPSNRQPTYQWWETMRNKLLVRPASCFHGYP